MTKAEEIYHRFVNYEWNEIGEGMKVSIIKAIDEALKEGQKLTLNDVSCSLPSKNERVTYCNDLANKHGVTEIFKKETLIKGFHLGFRYAKSFIK